MENNKRIILYTYNIYASFVRKDIALLEKHFTVKTFYFNPTNKFLVPWVFLKHFFFLLFNARKSSLFITQFGGYQSYLPSLIGSWFRKPTLIVLGGTDCVSFPSINYGNFNKKVLGAFTKWSYQRATHLSPVHSSLVEGPYTYTDDDFPQQGYKVFCPNVKAGVTELHYGYDSTLFNVGKNRVQSSFIMVGYLNYPNYYRKGVDLMIELANKRSDLTFTIVGGTINNLPINSVPPNVTLVDKVTYDELQGLYASHEFCMQLSICEGFPSAICEGMLCGCIPIGSDVAAIPEIIGNTGFVLKKKSVIELESLINLALASNKHKLSKDARNRIIENYPLEERDKLIQLCKELILKGNRSASN